MIVDFRGLTPLIQVFDMPASIRFYCDVLGFTVVTASGPVPNCGWALLRRNADEIMLNTQFEDDNRPPISEGARQAAHKDTTAQRSPGRQSGSSVEEHAPNYKILFDIESIRVEGSPDIRRDRGLRRAGRVCSGDGSNCNGVGDR
jgi:catechol 2,3-dioxygenase-like lactoylglutathione lyase family enzyme